MKTRCYEHAGAEPIRERVIEIGEPCPAGYCVICWHRFGRHIVATVEAEEK